MSAHPPNSRAFQREADYVGLYFMARAGFDNDGVEHFWRRLAAEFPQDIAVASTHPASAERAAGLAAARAEIRMRQAAGAELRPAMNVSASISSAMATRR
jgi:predicted Zn-dependent protease